MGTIVAYSTSSVSEVGTLPGSPVSGDQVILEGLGESFVFQNGLWVGIEGSSYLLDYANGVTALSAVVIVNNEVRLANSLVHKKCDGICTALFDGKALVKTSGFAKGFSGLVTSSNYYLSTTSGTIVAAHEGGNIVLVGSAISTSTLLIKLGVGISTA